MLCSAKYPAGRAFALRVRRTEVIADGDLPQAPETELSDRSGPVYPGFRKTLLRTERDQNAEPWQRVSAAVGMAEYLPGRDRTVDEVLERADRRMYEEKKRMKDRRENAGKNA